MVGFIVVRVLLSGYEYLSINIFKYKLRASVFWSLTRCWEYKDIIQSFLPKGTSVQMRNLGIYRWILRFKKQPQSDYVTYPKPCSGRGWV